MFTLQNLPFYYKGNVEIYGLFSWRWKSNRTNPREEMNKFEDKRDFNFLSWCLVGNRKVER